VLVTTGDMDTVVQLLGHASIDCSQRYVDVNQDVLHALYADVV
jgi:site-specific recombinase XerD